MFETVFASLVRQEALAATVVLEFIGGKCSGQKLGGIFCVPSFAKIFKGPDLMGLRRKSLGEGLLEALPLEAQVGFGH